MIIEWCWKTRGEGIDIMPSMVRYGISSFGVFVGIMIKDKPELSAKKEKNRVVSKIPPNDNETSKVPQIGDEVEAFEFCGKITNIKDGIAEVTDHGEEINDVPLSMFTQDKWKDNCWDIGD